MPPKSVVHFILGLNISVTAQSSLSCVAGPRKYERARGDTRGERVGLPVRLTKIVSTRIPSVRILPTVREAPEGKINRVGREKCQSIAHGQRSEGLILPHQYNRNSGLGGHFSLV